MTEPLVTYDNQDGIVEIRFNRPSKHNSLTLEMFEAIGDTCDRLAADATARVAIVAGNGPSFCAGLDLSVMRALDDANEAQRLLATRPGQPGYLAQWVAFGWKAAPVPVIGVLTGVAFGGGFQIAAGCDLRYAAPDARLSIMESRYGLIPDMSITQTLPELVGRDVALELTLTAREFDAAEAHELGLVTRVCDDPMAQAQTLAAAIAARSPDAVRAIKRLYNAAWRDDAASGLALEQSIQLELIGGANQREAVTAAMEKRAPRFADPAA